MHCANISTVRLHENEIMVSSSEWHIIVRMRQIKLLLAQTHFTYHLQHISVYSFIEQKTVYKRDKTSVKFISKYCIVCFQKNYAPLDDPLVVESY